MTSSRLGKRIELISVNEEELHVLYLRIVLYIVREVC